MLIEIEKGGGREKRGRRETIYLTHSVNQKGQKGFDVDNSTNSYSRPFKIFLSEYTLWSVKEHLEWVLSFLTTDFI